MEVTCSAIFNFFHCEEEEKILPEGALAWQNAGPEITSNIAGPKAEAIALGTYDGDSSCRPTLKVLS